MKLVRLKPLNSKKGIVRSRHHTQGRLFEVTRGWYEVDDKVAAKLAEERYEDDPTDSDRPFIFDVKSPDEAQQIDDQAAAEKQGAADNPVRSPAAAPKVPGKRTSQIG